MAEEKTFLPLGSIVILQGSLKKIMIIARGTTDGKEYFDYGAVLYPEGLLDENVAYFRTENILKVVQEGYCDDDDALLVSQLTEAKKEFLEAAEQQAESRAPEQEAESVEQEDIVEDAAEEDIFASIRDMEES